MKQDWLDAFRVDGDAGPAAPLPPQATHALAAKAAERALSMSGSAAPVRLNRTWMHLTIVTVSGALLVLGAIAVSRTDTPADRAPVSAPTAMATVVPAEPTPTTVSPPIETVAVTSLPNAVDAPAATATAERPAAKVDVKTASDLLAEANDARRQSKWAEAAAIYERVMRSEADESYAATVALAALRLEHFGDPRGALVLYERALSARPGGSLTAQAEAGADRCRSALAGAASAQ